MHTLYYIEFKSADGKFFTSRHARYASIPDLIFDLQPYFKRFPLHTASWTVLEQENTPGEVFAAAKASQEAFPPSAYEAIP